ncbi:MAG: hypothetical protein HWD85_06190 [Flavobacteriaceae bacterium]|nr:hypothetical protein [Flavobacteriaceae bacterium]
MSLIELVDLFLNGKNFESFCSSQSLNINSEVIEVYMKKPFSITSELKFFEIEMTEGAIEYDYNGQLYYNLFDFYYFQETIEEFKNSNDLDAINIAKILISYSINDA